MTVITEVVVAVAVCVTVLVLGLIVLLLVRQLHRCKDDERRSLTTGYTGTNESIYRASNPSDIQQEAPEDESDRSDPNLEVRSCQEHVQKFYKLTEGVEDGGEEQAEENTTELSGDNAVDSMHEESEIIEDMEGEAEEIKLEQNTVCSEEISTEETSKNQ